MLRPHQGLVLDHDEAEDDDENVPGLHRESVWLNVQLNYDFQLIVIR